MTLTIKFEGGKQSGLIQLMKNQRSSQRHSSTLIRIFIPTWSQLLPSSWQCQCQLLPTNDLLARWTEWRPTYVSRWKQSDLQHLPWCVLTKTYPLMQKPWFANFRQKKQTSSFRISLSSTKISDMFATNVSLVRSLRCCCCCWPQLQLAAFC